MIKSLFRGSNIANTGEKFVEMIRAAIGIFQSLIVNYKPFTQVFGKIAVCPLAELHAADRSNAKPYR